MNRFLPLTLCLLFAAPACNDDSVFFPFASDTNSDSGNRDTSIDLADGSEDPDVATPDAGLDTSDADEDGPRDADPDGALDVPEDTHPPDAPEPDTEQDVELDTELDTEPDAEPGPCTPGSVCDDGGFCGFETEGCGFDPVCFADCPSVDETNVCSCDGVVVRANALCSGVEFAYILDDVDQRAELQGADCDPAEFGPLRYSVIVAFTEMDFAIGRILHIRVPSNWDDSFVLEERILIESDEFGFSVPNVLDTDLFGWVFEWYIDVDEDGTCGFPEELSWSRFESNPFDSGPVFVAFSGPDEPDEFTCEFWEDVP